MANKRFLGLGFTFSATDKGLEAKLQGINSALQGIADSLGAINSGASSASSAIGSIKAPTGTTRMPSSGGSDMGALLVGIQHLDSTTKKGITRLVKRDDLIISAIKKGSARVVKKLDTVSKSLFKMFAAEKKKSPNILIEEQEPKRKKEKDPKILLEEPKRKKEKINFLVPPDSLIDAAKLKLLQQIRDNTEKTVKVLEKGGIVRERASTRAPTMRQAAPEMRKPSQSGIFEDVFSKLSTDSKKLISDIEKTLGSDLGKQFAKQVQHLRVEFDDLGNFSLDTSKKLQKVSEAFIEGSEAIGSYKKSFNLAVKSFDFLKHWFHEIGSSVERFLSSVGVDLSTIIPEQFKALFGIAKAVFAPLLKGIGSLPKMLLGNLFKGEQSKIQGKMLESLRSLFSAADQLNKKTVPEMGSKITAGLNNLRSSIAPDKQIAVLTDISDKLGGRPSGTKNAMNYLETISANTKPEKKGLLAGIKDFFSNIGKMIPGFGMITGLLSKLGGSLLSVIAIGGLALEAGAFLSGFGKVVEKNWQVFQEFGKQLSHFTSSLLSFASKKLGEAADAVKTWVGTFVKSHPIIGKFVDLAKSAGDALANFAGKMMDVAKAIYEKLPLQFRETIANVGSLISDVFRDLLKTLAMVFTDPVGLMKKSLEGLNLLGQGFGQVLTDTTGFLSDKLKESSDHIDRAIGATTGPTPFDQTKIKPIGDDLSKLIGDQGDKTAGMMGRQLDMMKTQNDYLNEILKATQAGKVLNANIKVNGGNSDATAQMQALSMGVN